MLFLPCASLRQQRCLTACLIVSLHGAILLRLSHFLWTFTFQLLPNALNEIRSQQVQQINKDRRTSSRERRKCEESPAFLKPSGTASDGRRQRQAVIGQKCGGVTCYQRQTRAFCPTFSQVAMTRWSVSNASRCCILALDLCSLARKWTSDQSWHGNTANCSRRTVRLFRMKRKTKLDKSD